MKYRSELKREKEGTGYTGAMCSPPPPPPPPRFCPPPFGSATEIQTIRSTCHLMRAIWQDFAPAQYPKIFTCGSVLPLRNRGNNCCFGFLLGKLTLFFSLETVLSATWNYFSTHVNPTSEYHFQKQLFSSE